MSEISVDDTAASRDVVRQTLAFLQDHLRAGAEIRGRAHAAAQLQA